MGHGDPAVPPAQLNTEEECPPIILSSDNNPMKNFGVATSPPKGVHRPYPPEQVQQIGKSFGIAEINSRDKGKVVVCSERVPIRQMRKSNVKLVKILVVNNERLMAPFTQEDIHQAVKSECAIGGSRCGFESFKVDISGHA
ncbi:hypothetical protein G4B88_018595 [Cannabis sativa]|uniref:Uncharacterized protein n=1 Tax=Cannabis sativa TaxID=3483 RepID=A0A7J6HHA6_CANSA|nr:hypothetical protein G4B88_018595 [Cannabis sativa]